MKIHTSTMYLIGIIILLVVGGIFFLQSGTSDTTTTTISSTDSAQKVVIGIKNYNYYPNTITVKAGQPVSISLDSSVSGCYRSFTIRALGINKYLKTPKDTIEFTPTKSGTYPFACSMGMGTGTLIVT